MFNLYKAQGAFEQNLKTFTQYFFPMILDISLSVGLLLYYSNPLFYYYFFLNNVNNRRPTKIIRVLIATKTGDKIIPISLEKNRLRDK